MCDMMRRWQLSKFRKQQGTRWVRLMIRLAEIEIDRRTGAVGSSSSSSAAHRKAPSGILPRMGVDEVLAASRAGVDRLTPEQTVAAMRRGTLLVDTRTETQRREQGELPRALVTCR
jgi:hypothetical protein